MKVIYGKPLNIKILHYMFRKGFTTGGLLFLQINHKWGFRTCKNNKQTKKWARQSRQLEDGSFFFFLKVA